MVGDDTGIMATGTIWGFRFLCKTKVEDLHRPVRPQLDIRRLQIPVHDPLCVRGIECLDNWRAIASDSSDGIDPPRYLHGKGSSFATPASRPR